MRMESDEPVDCSNLAPAPLEAFVKWTHFSEDKPFVDEGQLKQNTHKWYAKGINYADCLKYFIYFPQYDKFAAVKQHQGLHVCYVPTNQFCDQPKGGELWNYAIKAVPEKCKAELCKVAKSGEWSEKRNWLSWLKKKSWPRTLPNGMGFEDVFKKCWHGPKAFGDLLPDFNDFMKRYNLQTPSGSFNKKACE